MSIIKNYVCAERLEDLVMRNIEEIRCMDDHGDPNIATIQGAMIDALEWVVSLIDAECEIDIRNSFIGDKCKVADMVRCTKDGFLKSYSYITEDEYDTTFDVLLEMLPFSKDSLEEYEKIMEESEV